MAVIFLFVVVDTVVVVGEHCHVLFVDSKIRERELRSLAPVIDPCTMPEGNVMLNPKPLLFEHGLRSGQCKQIESNMH